ncbi:MAG: FAD-dependent oxidoreductase [Phycisphaerae bacterium]
MDPRFLTESGLEIFTGNELVIKGALEAEGGVHLLGGYPGSPVAGFFDSMPLIKDLLNEKGIRAVINNNEALAAAMLNGSQVAGCRAIIAMKSVGVHVAADALALGSLAGAHSQGGAIVIYGDDPWSDSTQVPSDSRYISKHLFIPVIEPSNPQEVKDFVDLALKLSRQSELYMGFILPNNLADGGGSVQCRPNQYPSFNTHQRLTMDTAAMNPDKFVLLPPRTWTREEKYAPRFAQAVAIARQMGLNRIEYSCSQRRPIGIATSGMAHGYVVQALWEMGLLGQVPILKFGMSYPMDAELVGQFAQAVERIVVIEERRGFLEEQISQVILQARQQGTDFGVEVWGKVFPGGLSGIPATRGLDPSILISRLAPLLKRVQGDTAALAVPADIERMDRELEQLQSTAQADIKPFPPRTPTFCPGCPHRDSASLCLEIRRRFEDADYMRRVHRCGPLDLVFHGDTGCYTMLMFPPTSPLMHNYSGMGLGAGTGSGMDPFITNKQVVFMGDSTFFHSGQIAISQAIKLGQDITFIILDNSTTGMTGHQPTPGVDYDILGNPTAVQDIEEIVNGLSGSAHLSVVRADPEKRTEYADLLERTFLADGVKVVIADKECGITRTRRKRRSEREVVRRLGYLPRWQHININQEICRFCLTCSELTGCPGLRHSETDYGPKMDTDLTWCVADGACHRLGACSSFEQVTIRRKRPARSRVPELALDDIPEPQKRSHEDIWRCCLIGVGSQGIGTATQILVRAGHKEGYKVAFLDKKGLAIRNGGVTSQVIYNITDQPVTPVIPYGKADLMIGLDVLEAARALDPKGRSRIASPERTAAVINTDKFLTIPALMGQSDFDPDELERMVRAHTRSDDYLARNISRICEKYLGSKLFANVMMLGFAFQKGLIPVSMHSMAWAIKDTIRADFRKNLYAFNMGRKLVVDMDLFGGPPRRTEWRDILDEKCRWTIRRYFRGQQKAQELRELAAGLVDKTDLLDEPLKAAVVVRLYDCMRWGGMDYARRYADAVASVYRKDKAAHGYAATRAVIHNLAKAMLIKDGFFIAELATSGEKVARDREKYNVNPANGDRISYHHLLHGEVKLLGRSVPLKLAVPSWQLSLVKRLAFMRRILPGHRSQQRFLHKYEQAAMNFSYSSQAEYCQATAVLASPQCMQCVSPRCQETGCPLGNEIPRWVDLALAGQWEQASRLLHERNNFPEITARICPAPCQVACKQSLSDMPVQVREIERQIVERAFASDWLGPQTPARKSGKKVAVIGSGPAGLTAAQQLARAGHEVTVFEKDPAPGGLLRYGIPTFRLDKKLLDRRLEQLAAEGVSFRSGVEVGRDVTAEALREQFDAICLATGAARPRDLNVPGREQDGVYYAMDFLRQENLRSQGNSIRTGSEISAKGKVVAVIGGGLTGEDCVDTALMQGARQVHQFEILPQPAANGHGAIAAAAQVVREYGAMTKQFGGDGRRITEIRGIKVRWLESDRGPLCAEVPDSDFRVKVDMAVLAMGFEPGLESALAGEFSLATDEKGRIVTEEGATSQAGVFVAGDVQSGPTYVASAIASGRAVAARISRFLNNGKAERE